MKVKATKKGYDGWSVRNIGDIFEIKDSQYSIEWMERVDDGVEINDEKSKFVDTLPDPPLKRSPGRPKGSRNVI